MPGSHTAEVLGPAFLLREAWWGYWPSLALASLWLLGMACGARRHRHGRPLFVASLPVTVWSLQAIASLLRFFEGHAHGSREWLTLAWAEALALVVSAVLLSALLLPGAVLLRRLGLRATGQGITVVAAVTVALDVLLVLATVTAAHLLGPTEPPALR